MPDIDFSPEFKTATRTEYNRLSLKKDEKARVALLGQLKFAYTHTLRAPEFDEDGRPKMRVVKRRGVDTTEIDLGFVGRPLCVGDYGIVSDKGLDPDNCPVCEAANSEPEYFSPPEKRFGINVIRYATNRDGQLAKPFSCSCFVWTFADRMYNQLTDIATELATNGKTLRDHDLLLTCKVESFQNYEIIPAMQAVWQQTPEVKQRVLDTLEQQGTDDVEGAIGRRTDKKWLPKDIDRVYAAWAQYKGTDNKRSQGPDITQESPKKLADELGSLLDDKPTGQPPAAQQSNDLAAMVTPTSPDAAAKSAEPVKVDDSMDLSKLLSELG